jgi:class 3 adenylate cyclase
MEFDLTNLGEETPDSSADGERKTVTMLFADIKGSMDLIEDLDPEEARAIVDPALKLMMEAVQRYGGYIAQSTGDGIFALLAHRSRMKTTRSVHCLQRCGCSPRSGATRISCELRKE